MNPVAPLTLWVLISIAGTAIMVGGPLLMGFLSERRARKDAQDKDVTALVGPIIAAGIKVHNDEMFAHPMALARYVTMDQFNAALNAMRGEIRADVAGLRQLIQSNEDRRKEDVQMFRDDFDKLKENVSRAIGRRDKED